jgi:hypothetical protein
MSAPGAPTAATPGYTERVRAIVAHAATTAWAPVLMSFGFDVLDTIADGFDAWGFDTVDVLGARQRDIPTLCPRCRQAWLSGPEALAANACWRCHT